MIKKQRAAFEDALIKAGLPLSTREIVFRELDNILGKKFGRAKKDYTLQEWESFHSAPLNVQMMATWISSNGYCPVLIGKLIGEFRIEMMSKDKRYADFKLAFMNYLNKGYLSKRAEQVLLATSPHRTQSGTTVYNRGGVL